ncbi:hypothetical protein Pcinc_006017 [Petrolisthes cinctipes]|uniref:Uncharacterized protein n=1 Tax=Petrolisthes cinctipes TaxID=88211 RepID=A0AAE1L200_PETCI|nr:hypothetical protein Pcinc_006017 [Petrolisthes cinctipes]
MHPLPRLPCDSPSSTIYLPSPTSTHITILHTNDATPQSHIKLVPPPPPCPSRKLVPPSPPRPGLKRLPPSPPRPRFKRFPPSPPRPRLKRVPPSPSQPGLKRLPPSRQRRHHHCLATTYTRQQRCHASCVLTPPRPPLPRLSNTNTHLLHTSALTPSPQY